MFSLVDCCVWLVRVVGLVNRLFALFLVFGYCILCGAVVLCVLVVVGCGVFGLLFGLVVVLGWIGELVSLVACGCLWYDILVAVF